MKRENTEEMMIRLVEQVIEKLRKDTLELDLWERLKKKKQTKITNHISDFLKIIKNYKIKLKKIIGWKKKK